MAAIERERSLNAALLHLAANRYGDARALLERVLADCPENWRIRLGLAYSHSMCGDAAGCREALRGVAREGIAGALASLIEARLELEAGNATKALALIGTAESLGGALPIVNYAAGLMYARTGGHEDAERRLRRAIELDPAFQPAYTALSGVLSDQGKDAAAAQAALESLEVDYSSAISHFALGIAMLGAGTGEQARAAFERSLAFDPQIREAREWMAALGQTQ